MKSLLLASLFTVVSSYAMQSTYSNNSKEEAGKRFEAEIREREQKQRELLDEWMHKECIKKIIFSFREKIFHAKWVAECLLLERKLTVSERGLDALRDKAAKKSQ